ncbi:MAG: hypothetical protein CMJ76_02060 [Planctomycetaceae bacterium]|nr:hypothetical protein [Planctomycetaceae bacterium]|tara:strand:+ start:4082 stop:4261 length:180 start_codon:yes stop_codon:yes gene_type:complete
MFTRGTSYTEVRDSLKKQTLNDKQTFLESMINYFLRMEQTTPNRLLEIEGAIDSILEQD